ncbi:zf-CCHC domain-containing protein [Tanacetum coccineum]
MQVLPTSSNRSSQPILALLHKLSTGSFLHYSSPEQSQSPTIIGSDNLLSRISTSALASPHHSSVSSLHPKKKSDDELEKMSDRSRGVENDGGACLDANLPRWRAVTGVAIGNNHLMMMDVLLPLPQRATLVAGKCALVKSSHLVKSDTDPLYKEPSHTIHGDVYKSPSPTIDRQSIKVYLHSTAIEESKDLSSLALDELIGNLKVHEVVMEKDSEIYRGKKERVKSYSAQVWEHVKRFTGIPNIPYNLSSIVDFLIPLAKMRSAKSVIAKLIFAASCYFIWQERNYRLFKKKKRSQDQVIDIIMSTVRLKLMNCRFKKTSIVQMLSRLWKLPTTLIVYQGISPLPKKKKRVTSIVLKAKKEYSDDESLTSGSDDEEYAMAVRNFKKFFRRKGKFVRQPREEKKSFRQRDEKKGKSDRKCFRCGDPNHLIGDCPKPSRNKDQKAFIGGSWSDSENDAEDKTNDETCLMAQSSNEVTLNSSYYSDNASSLDNDSMQIEYDSLCEISLKIINKNKILKTKRDLLEKEILELNEKIKKLEKSKEIEIACKSCEELKSENAKLKETQVKFVKFDKSANSLREMLNNQKSPSCKIGLGIDSSKASTSRTKIISFVESSTEKAIDGSTIKVHGSTMPGFVSRTNGEIGT